MLKAINKIPAGTFLVPMVISMLIYTFWPDAMLIGGVTESWLSGSGTGFIIGMLSFASGTTISFKRIGDLLKHQGVLLLVKVIIATILSFIFLFIFGDEGIFGISGIAFLAIMFSINPSVQVSILSSYGYEKDSGILALSGVFTLPFVPMLVYSIYASGSVAGIDWMPIVSTLVPLLVGIILGNIDEGFTALFSPAVGALLPLLGWNLGQTMNVIEALRSGVSGLIITAFFVLVFSVLYFVDTKALGYEGVSGVSFITVAGTSTVIAPTIAETFPQVAPYVTSANSQILFATIALAILSPMVAKRLYVKEHGDDVPEPGAAAQEEPK